MPLQVGDQGVLRAVGGGGVLVVGDVRKAAGGRLFVHSGEVQHGGLRVGQQVCADGGCRMAHR